MATEDLFAGMIQKARENKDKHVGHTLGSDRIVVTCIPDTIDRIEWFCNGIHISSSYAKVLIERHKDDD